MWGNSVFLKTPQTAYSMTYQDPSKVLEQQRALAELFKEVANQEPGTGPNLLDQEIYKGYIEEKGSGSEFDDSLEEAGDQALPD